MTRRPYSTNFDIARYVAKLDRDDTSHLVSDALRHLDTDEIIELVVTELERPGKLALLKRLKKDLDEGP